MLNEIMEIIRSGTTYTEKQQGLSSWVKKNSLILPIIQRYKGFDIAKIKITENEHKKLQDYEKQLEIVIKNMLVKENSWELQHHYEVIEIMKLIYKFKNTYGIDENKLYFYTAYSRSLEKTKKRLLDQIFNFAMISGTNENTIREIFKEKKNENLRQIILNYVDILPKVLVKYITTQISTYKENKEQKIVPKITNKFEQRIFEMSLPDKLDQKEIKEIIKNYDRDLSDADYLVSVYNLTKSVSLKYDVISEKFIDLMCNKIVNKIEQMGKNMHNQKAISAIKALLDDTMKNIITNRDFELVFASYLQRKAMNTLSEHCLNVLWRMFKEEEVISLIEKRLLKNIEAEQNTYVSYKIDISKLDESVKNEILRNVIFSYGETQWRPIALYKEYAIKKQEVIG